MKVKRNRKRRGRGRRWLWAALALACCLAVALAAWSAFRLPRNVAARRIGEIPGLSARIAEAGADRIKMTAVRYAREKRELFTASKVELRFGGEKQARRLMEIRVGDALVRDFSGLWKLAASYKESVSAFTGTLSASGFWGADRRSGIPFRLRWTPGGRRALEVVFSKPELTVTGEMLPGERELQLRFSGNLNRTLLKAAGVELPAELVLPAQFTVSGAVQVSPETFELTTPLTASGLFLSPAVIQGGFWQVNPGGHYSFRWEGPGRAWRVGFPEAELTMPFAAPLGELAVQGGEGPEWRFSVDSVPTVGEVAGRFRLEGRFDPAGGDWEFRQAASSDQAVKWQLSGAPGTVGCVWRAPKISGQGRGMRGEVTWLFDFDRLDLRVAGNRHDFSARPGRVTGNCRFDLTRPDAASFRLSGTLQANKLEWSDPASAWGATRAEVGFELSRRPGEQEWEYKLNPLAANVNVYGATLPKLKLENPSAEFQLRMLPGDERRYPEEIRGSMTVDRATLVESSFGTGEMERIRLSGSVFPDDRGRIGRHELFGSIERSSTRLEQLALEGASISFESRFNRALMDPGANCIVDFRGTGGVLGVEEIRFDGGRFEGRAAGEMRQDELLPPGWTVQWRFPAGTFAGNGFTGSTGLFAGRTELVSGGAQALNVELRDLKAASSVAVSNWSARIPVAKLDLVRSGAELGGLAVAGQVEFDAIGEGGRQYGFSGGELSLPLLFPDWEKARPGSIKATSIRVPGNFLSDAQGTLRLKPNGLSFEGQAGSRFFSGPVLRLNAMAGRLPNGEWSMDGNLELPVTQLAEPIRFGEFFPAASGVRLTGKVGGEGDFRFAGGSRRWNLTLRPFGAELAGPQFKLSGISGMIRVPGEGAGYRDSGGGLTFDGFSAAGITLGKGMVNWLSSRPGVLEVQDASGSLWGGRARLAAPLVWTASRPGPEFALQLNDINLETAARILNLPAGVIAGRGDGTVTFRGGAKPEPVALELISRSVRHLRFQPLEKYVDQRGGNTARRRMVLEALRDFNCRELRLRAVRSGDMTDLELAVAGRSERPLTLPDDKLNRLVDIDTDMELMLTYRIPASGGVRGDGKKP